MIARVLQGDTLAPYMLITCLDYALRRQKLWHADYADDQTLPADTPAQAEYLLRSLEQAAGRIDLSVKANKTGFMCFKREAVLSVASL